ncbi:MAG: hypothetical protein AAF386_12280 [Pseudomonadota bacterium]
MTYFGLAIGAAWGVFLAARRKGKRLDLLHYGVTFGIIGGLLGMIAGIVIARMG